MKYMAKGMSAFPSGYWKELHRADGYNEKLVNDLLSRDSRIQQATDVSGNLASDYLTITVLNGLQQSLKHGARIYTVAPKMLEMAERSDLLTTLTGKDIRPPLPAMNFWLPRKCGRYSFFTVVFHETVVNGEVVLPLTMTDAGTRHAHLRTKNVNVTPIRAMSILSHEGGDMGSVGAAVIPLYEDKTIHESLMMIVNDFGDDASPEHVANTKTKLWADPDKVKIMVDELKRTCGKRIEENLEYVSSLELAQMFNVICQFITVLSSYPEYCLDRPVQQKINGVSSEKRKGKSKVLTVYLREVGCPQGFSGLSDSPQINRNDKSDRTVKMHWRSGHWRRQRHSMNWELNNPGKAEQDENGVRYHLLWIQPCLVSQSK